MPGHIRLARCLGAAALLLGPATAAFAHAVLMESTPAADGTAASGHVDIVLRYNSRIDRARSRVSLTRPDGSQGVLPIAASSPVDALDSSAELGAGAYVLHWQVLAVDGHITRGDVPFTVTGSVATKDQGH